MIHFRQLTDDQVKRRWCTFHVCIINFWFSGTQQGQIPDGIIPSQTLWGVKNTGNAFDVVKLKNVFVPGDKVPDTLVT